MAFTRYYTLCVVLNQGWGVDVGYTIGVYKIYVVPGYLVLFVEVRRVLYQHRSCSKAPSGPVEAGCVLRLVR